MGLSLLRGRNFSSAVFVLVLSCGACSPAPARESAPQSGPISTAAQMGMGGEYSVYMQQQQYEIGVAQAQDTIRKLFATLRPRRVLVGCSSCMAFEMNGYEFVTYSQTLRSSEALLSSRFDAPQFASVRQFIHVHYPKPGERPRFYEALEGREYYIPARTAQTMLDSALMLITRLEVAGRNPLHALRLDIQPLGARVTLQALGGPPKPGIANYPITGLWLGQYDYIVELNNVVRARGQVDLIDNSGRTLWCRFDVREFAHSGCVQQ